MSWEVLQKAALRRPHSLSCILVTACSLNMESTCSSLIQKNEVYDHGRSKMQVDLIYVHAGVEMRACTELRAEKRKLVSHWEGKTF